MLFYFSNELVAANQARLRKIAISCPLPTLRGEEADIALHYCTEEGLVLHAILHDIARYCVRYRPLPSVTGSYSHNIALGRCNRYCFAM